MDLSRIQLIAGLGNPGPDYIDTRHNAGAWLVERFAALQKKDLQSSNKFHGYTAKIEIDVQPCHLLIPTTFMNLSGQAVSAVANFYKIEPKNILIVHDELDLVPGIARLKFGGGHGGHNGLRDIFKALGSQDFYRLRIGIGKPTGHEDVADYVLNKPRKAELDVINSSITDVLALMPDIIAGKIEAAMKMLHTKK